MGRNVSTISYCFPPKSQYQGIESPFHSDCQRSEISSWACVPEKLKTLKEVALLLGCSSPKSASVMLQILRLHFHVDFHHCPLVDRLIVHIFHHWLVVWTALIEPMLLDPEVMGV